MSAAPALMRRRALFIVLVLGIPSFVASVALFLLSGHLFPPPSHGADGFSRSAIGYRGLYTLLGAWGYGVLQSRCNTAERAGPGDLVILAEPSTAHEYAVPKDIITAAIARGGKVLLILPKWEGEPHAAAAGWVGSARAIPLSQVQTMLDLCDFLDAPTVVRASRGPEDSWESDEELPALPALPSPQLVDAEGIDGRALLWQGEGGLVLSNEEGTFYVVSDPDLLNNAGLGRGRNAAIVHALFTRVIRPHGVVMDETTHGHFLSDSLWHAAVRYPLILFSAPLALLLALALWRGMRRFGAPEPMPPRLATGKAGLLDNTAEFLVAGGHTDAALQAYMALALQLAGRRLGTGPDRARLAALTRARGLAHDPEGLAAAVQGFSRHRWRAALAHAAAIHAWRAELCREGDQRYAT